MSEERYIPINKGHFELDTPERTAEFSRRLASGWEEEYRSYRVQWIELPKKRILREYPLLLDLELSSVCNLRCPMCYTITDAFRSRVKKGLMDFSLYTRLVDEAAGKIVALRLSLRGEPTLHPRFLEAVAYAKRRGICEVSFLTNGSTLNLPFFRDLVAAGADWVSISIDGTDEEYERIRNPLKFTDVVDSLRAIKDFKDRHSLTKPVIKVQGIWPAIRKNPTRYYHTLAPLSDLVAFNPLIDYLRLDKDIVYEENFACPQPYQRLVIGSDGAAMMCANDEDGEQIVGNAYDQSIHEIWHGEKLAAIRRTHEQPGGFHQIPVCNLCYYPRKTEPNEKAQVGDRVITIENYINRSQTVGT